MKKKNILIITVVLIILVVSVCSIFIIKSIDENQKIKEKEKLESKLTEIKNHYSENVITNKKTKLYKQESDKYIEFGEINNDVVVSLEKHNITLDTEYFNIAGMDIYIYYKDVDPIQDYALDDRYKNYIYFNENLTTKEITNFYDINNKYLYSLKQSFDFKILVKDDDKYGVVYNNQLMYIKKEDVEKTYYSDNNQSNKDKIRTLTYHAIYNPENTSCETSICQSLELFESHLKYIRENGYFTLKLGELEMYLDGKINIPEKSIVLTIDDGTILDQEALALLDKYQTNATLFVITSSVSTENFKSDYLDLESHSDNMHNQYECPGYGSQGGGILCLPEEQVLSDLKTSQEKLGGSYYFAYPFFDFNDRAISLLKQAGFHMAFIGQYDTEGYSYPNKTDKFKVRRMTIFSETTMEEFISYLN